MRIYGSSPLYNYVELLFRCKRMFIVAIILGTVVTSWAAATRATQYRASMFIKLIGERPSSAPGGGEKDEAQVSVVRKASRLVDEWLPRTAFLTEVIKNSGLDRRHPNKSMDELIREVRDAIDKPELRSGILEVSMVWKDPEEAEAVLGQVYSVFARRTVDEETAAQTSKLSLLEQQLNKYEAEADQQAKRRQLYLQTHWWQNPTLAGTTITGNSAAEQQLADLELNRTDALSRLAQIETRLKTTPARILQAETKRFTADRPDLALMDQKKELEAQLVALKTRYTDIAPPVVALKKQIEQLDQQIADARKAPKTERDSGSERTTELNPEYIELRKMQSSFSMSLTSLDRQIRKLRETIARNDERLKAMPEEEVQFAKINREFSLADNLRNQLRNQYYTLKVQAERDRLNQALLVSQPPDFAPKAEPLNQGAKNALLYLAGPILGILLAFCFSLLAETMDHSLRTPVDVEKHLGKPVLAVIPRVSATPESRGQIGGQASPSITS
jgi:uncharacterized protein involved in exopolysaccharide biosynthesis